MTPILSRNSKWMKSMEKLAIIVGAAVMIVVIPLQAAERAMEANHTNMHPSASLTTSNEVTQ